MDNRIDDLELLRDAFWRERVYGFRELSEEKIRKRMEYLDLHLPGPCYCVVLFAPYLMEKEADTIDRSLANILKRVRHGYRAAGLDCFTILDNYCNIVAILSLTSGAALRKVERITTVMSGELIRDHDVEMFVGIGETVDRIADLNRSKYAAAEALAYKFTFSQDHVISVRDVKRVYNQGETELKVHYDRVMGCFYDGNMDLMAVRLRELFNQIGDDLDSVCNVCIELTATLYRVVREMGIEGTPEIQGVYTQIARMTAAVEIEDWFLDHCAMLLRQVGELRKDKTRQILEMAESYIESHLGDPDLTIQSISDYVGLSSPYFSNIFSRAKNIHVNEYINRSRVRRAQQMLLENNEKVAEIARILGFSSPSYFNSVFKRYTGVTPNAYRNNR